MNVRVLCSNSDCRVLFEVPRERLEEGGMCPQCGTPFVVHDGALVATRAYESRHTGAREIPIEFGRYEIISKIGHGGMGAVYLARDTQLDRRVAIKVPLSTQRDNPEVFERFQREAKTAACFHHPNFCAIHEVGQFGGWNYLVMPYIEGQTLASMIARDGAMPLRRAAAITRKLALALQEAHDQGIIHRDLKPSNVMVNRRRELIIMDFGLARREGHDDPELTHSGAVLGSPHYMAPEQVRAEHDRIGPATDIYALGVMLYEMLTARRPYSGSSSLVLGLIATSAPEPPSKYRPGIDREIEAICLKAMAREPDDRFRSMTSLVAALEAYLGGQIRPGAGPPPVAPASHLGVPTGAFPEEIELVPEPEVVNEPPPATVFVADEESDPEYASTPPTEVASIQSGSDPGWPGSIDVNQRQFSTPAVKSPKRVAQPKRTVKRRAGRIPRLLVDLFYVALCVGALGAGLGLFAYWMTTGRGTVRIVPLPSTTVRVDGQIISREALKGPIELAVGKHVVESTQENVIISTQEIEIVLGENSAIHVRREPKTPGTR
jgi:serine/threonine protein kinase